MKTLRELRPFDVLPASPSRVRAMVVGEVEWRPFKVRIELVTADGTLFETTMYGHQATPVEVEDL